MSMHLRDRESCLCQLCPQNNIEIGPGNKAMLSNLPTDIKVSKF